MKMAILLAQMVVLTLAKQEKQVGHAMEAVYHQSRIVLKNVVMDLRSELKSAMT